MRIIWVVIGGVVLVGGLLLAMLLIPGGLGWFYNGCLPEGVALMDTVSIDIGGANRVTVQQKLLEVSGYCANNTLVSGSGKPIYFYGLTGCWDLIPPDYREVLQKQQDEIATLETQYTGIEMTCNPSGRLLF